MPYNSLQLDVKTAQHSGRIKTRLIRVGLLCGAMGLTACATAKPALHGQSDTFGAAVKANIAAQAIAPSQAQKENTYIPANAARTALARKNYRENTLPEPEPISTTSGSGN